MKYAWIMLAAGVGIITAASVRMMDIFVLQAGIVSAAGGITALFLNEKRKEAMKEEEISRDHDDFTGKTAA